MKNIVSYLIIASLLVSCNSASSISKNDVCGKRFISSTTNSMNSSISFDTGTIFKCNGTFESGAVSRATGHNSVDRAHFTGNWEIIKDIPEDVKQAVVKYGLDHNDYSIIKYASSNGINGYCLYYKISGYNTITLAPLYLDQVSMYEYQKEHGALGIFGGNL